MADFYDSIRDNLENRPEPEFNPADWEDMKQRIQGQSRRLAPLFWWTAAALLLLLLGSNAWWYTQDFSAPPTSAVTEKTVYVYDTIVRTEIVYRTDTLLQYRNRPTTATGAQDFIAMQNALAFHRKIAASATRMQRRETAFRQGYIVENLLGRATKSLRATQFPDTATDENLLAALQKNNFSDETALDFLPVDFSPIAVNNLAPAQNLTPLPLPLKDKYRRRLLQKAWRTMQPTGVLLAAEGGYVFPRGVGTEDRYGYMAGMRAGVVFSPALRLTVAGNFQHIQYQVDEMNEEIGVPVVEPPNDNLDFQQADVRQPSLQLAVGLQYLFRAQKDFRPYVGVGFGAYSLLPAELKYTFVNPDDLELIAEYDTEARGWQGGDVHLQAGFEFRLSEHWHIPLGINYIFNSAAGTPRVLHTKAGIIYQF